METIQDRVSRGEAVDAVPRLGRLRGERREERRDAKGCDSADGLVNCAVGELRKITQAEPPTTEIRKEKK